MYYKYTFRVCALKIFHVFRLACAFYPISFGITTLSSADRVFVVHADYVNAARNARTRFPRFVGKNDRIRCRPVGPYRVRYLYTYNAWAHNILYFVTLYYWLYRTVYWKSHKRYDGRNDIGKCLQ